MTDPKQKKKKWALRIVIPLVLILLFFADKIYYGTFYAQTEAYVILSDREIVGTGGTQFGSHAVENKIIEIEFISEDGIKYTTRIPANSKGYISPGSSIPIKYRKSNPYKCFLN